MSFLSLASKFHCLKMCCQVRRESTLSELQEVEKPVQTFYYFILMNYLNFYRFSDYRKPQLTFFFLRNCCVEKRDRDCYGVNVISECITQSFVICQKHKQKHSMCHSLQKISGFIA